MAHALYDTLRSRLVAASSHYVLLSVLLFAGLEMVFAFQRWIWAVGAVLVLLLVAGILLVRFEEGGQFHPLQIVLPLLAALGLITFAIFLPVTPLLHVYFLAATAVFFFSLKHGVRHTYPVWNWTLTLIVFFLNEAAIFGLRFHLYIPILLVLGLTWVVTASLFLQAARYAALTVRAVVLPALSAALVLTQIVWLFQFLPTHYLVEAGIITAIYYTTFNLVVISYKRKISRRDILEYGGLGVITSIIILATARWT